MTTEAGRHHPGQHYAVLLFVCPLCNAPAGGPCRSRRNRDNVVPPHGARVKLTSRMSADERQRAAELVSAARTARQAPVVLTPGIRAIRASVRQMWDDLH